MCGVIGMLGPNPVNQALYDGLTIIQHRGQDAAGIITSDGNRVYLRKDNGLVRDVFHTRHMLQLKGTMGIGHTRYPTAGCDSRAEAQPFYVNSPFGIALGHNGNLTNAATLREELFRQDLRQLNTSSDSEILLNVFAHELRAAIGASSLRATPDDLFNAVSGVFARCSGAYAVVVMVVGVGILAFRDPCGIRPLVYGSMPSDKKFATPSGGQTNGQSARQAGNPPTKPPTYSPRKASLWMCSATPWNATSSPARRCWWISTAACTRGFAPTDRNIPRAYSNMFISPDRIPSSTASRYIARA